MTVISLLYCCCCCCCCFKWFGAWAFWNNVVCVGSCGWQSCLFPSSFLSSVCARLSAVVGLLINDIYVCISYNFEEVCMSVVCKQLRCLMYRSEQIGIPLRSHLCCASLKMVLFQLSVFFSGSWLIFFSLYGAVYNLNILCTYPTQWVEQTNIQKQIDVVNTVR